MGTSFFVSEHIPFREEHTVEGFLSFARHIGAEKMIYDGRLPVTCESPIQGDYCVIHPYSSRKEKDWPYERYHPIKEAIEKRGLRVVMTGTPFFKTTLPEFIALLSKAKFLISPDTGPMHIASGFGVPTIALFAPTSPLLTGPYFTQDYVINKHPEVLATYQPRRQWNVRVYEKGAMALISVDDVLQKVESLLEQQRP